RRLDILELGSLLADRVDDAPVAVADVDRHQLAVEVEDPLTLGRVEVDPLRPIDRDRVDRPLGGPREERVLPTEPDDLLARHPAGCGADAHGPPRAGRCATARLNVWMGRHYITPPAARDAISA